MGKIFFFKKTCGGACIYKMFSLYLRQNQTETRAMTTTLTETLAKPNIETMEKQTSTTRQYAFLPRRGELTGCVLYAAIRGSHTAFFLTDA